MKHLPRLFENNRAWAEEVRRNDPGFFERLRHQQAPAYLWIGCSDSRVPANQIVGLMPGEMFVHRNVANVFVHSDLNALSTLHFAVEVLRVSHVVVCGHYGCGGVGAALRGERHGLVAGHPNAARSWAFVLVGHLRHHAKVLTERYGVAVPA